MGGIKAIIREAPQRALTNHFLRKTSAVDKRRGWMPGFHSNHTTYQLYVKVSGWQWPTTGWLIVLRNIQASAYDITQEVMLFLPIRLE